MNDYSQIYLLLASFALGLRHGLDWDHIAAIVDITASDVGMSLAGTNMTSNMYSINRTCWLSTCYVLGHALVVISLGLAAKSFVAFFPTWFDTACEHVVGLSLVLFSFWVFYVIVGSLILGKEPILQSRWMLASAGLRKLLSFIDSTAPNTTTNHTVVSPDLYHHHVFRGQIPGPFSFTLGMLHGLGIETGTQILVLSTAGVSTNYSSTFTCIFLLTFISGMIISNSLVAIGAALGLRQSVFFKPLYLLSGLFAGIFSLIVGASLILGFNT